MAEYYVRSTGGSDGNTGLTFAQGWATLAYAFSNSTTGDTLYICSNSSNPFLTTTAWVITSPRQFIGCSLTDGSAYNGANRAYIKRSTGSDDLVTINSASDNNTTLWQDICFHANYEADYALNVINDSYIYDYIFRNCEFIEAVMDGAYIHASSTVVREHYCITFHHCNFYNNWSAGFQVLGNNHTPAVFLNNCSVHNNSWHNVVSYARNTLTLYNCRVFRGGATGVSILNDWSTVQIYNCVISLNDLSGIQFPFPGTACNITLLNSIVSHNVTWGVFRSDPPNISWLSASYNCFYGNGFGNLNPYANGGVIPGIGNITTDPRFVSTVSGSEDFRLKSDSPCLNTGNSFRSGF